MAMEDIFKLLLDSGHMGLGWVPRVDHRDLFQIRERQMSIQGIARPEPAMSGGDSKAEVSMYFTVDIMVKGVKTDIGIACLLGLG